MRIHTTTIKMNWGTSFVCFRERPVSFQKQWIKTQWNPIDPIRKLVEWKWEMFQKYREHSTAQWLRWLDLLTNSGVLVRPKHSPRFPLLFPLVRTLGGKIMYGHILSSNGSPIVSRMFLNDHQTITKGGAVAGREYRQLTPAAVDTKSTSRGREDAATFAGPGRLVL